MPRPQLKATPTRPLAFLVATVVIACSSFCGAAPAAARTACTFLDDNANGPCYVVEPTSGPVGTRIHFRVRVAPQHQWGFLHDWRKHPHLAAFQRLRQTDGSHCAFIIPSASSHWRLIRTEPYDPGAAVNPKAVVGWLTIGGHGSCEGQDLRRVTPGRYLLSSSGRHGAFARFRISTDELPRTGTRDFRALVVVGFLLILTGYGVRVTAPLRRRS